MRTKKSESVRILLALTVVILLIAVVLGILSPTFLSYGNLSDLLMRMSPLGMLAIAETIVFIGGGFDLTIGVVMALSAAVCGSLYTMGVPFPIAIVAALFSGVAAGLLNAVLIVQLKLQSFIVTLATMTILRSTVYAMLKGNVLTEIPESFLELRYVYVWGIPLLFVVLAIVAVAMVVMMRYTTIGRSIFAVGGNGQTAFLSGIYVTRVQYFIYCLSGFIAAFAGLLYTVRVRAIIPDTGINAPLEVVTAVLIGGTSIAGGKGSILGSLLGILAMFILLNGFSLLGLNPFWEVIILGLILICVVGQTGIIRGIRMVIGKVQA
jgi:ribose transport system permease protein